MLIYQEVSLREALDLYPMVWDIPAQVRHHQANHTLLITNLASIPGLHNHNHDNSQQYTATILVVDSPMPMTKISIGRFLCVLPYDTYADDAIGPNPGGDEAGEHFMGNTSWSEEGARTSFQDEKNYGRQS